MIISPDIKQLWQGFCAFYRFSPGRLTIIFALMFTQGVSAGVGLLLIIPLLQIVGLNTGASANSKVVVAAKNIFAWGGVSPTLINILIVYVGIIIIIATLRYQFSIMSTSVQQQYISHLRSHLYRRLLKSNWQFIAQQKLSDFAHCLSGQVQTIGYASQLMLSFAGQMVLMLVMIGISFLLSWQMTSLAALFGIGILLILFPFNRLAFSSGLDHLINFKSIFQMLTEQLSSLKMIKSFASETHYADKMELMSKALEDQQLRLTRLNGLSRWTNTVATAVAFCLFFYFALQVFTLPLTTILLLLVIFSRLLPQLSTLQNTWQQLVHRAPAFTDVNTLDLQCAAAREPATNGTATPLLTQAIHIENISYRHPGKNRAAISDLSVEIKKNQTVSVTGPSGAGKSTLADLIAGLLEPDSGRICCDETPLEGMVRIAWRNKVAYVTQEVFLFHDTIRANLNWVVSEKVSDEMLWDVLRQAAAEGFVKELPEGLQTVIGDQGVRLSGGERQRLALARALLTEPQLLILDEATSALDDENERKIQKALQQLHGKLTVLIIAHRETTIDHADQRIELPGYAVDQT